MIQYKHAIASISLPGTLVQKMEAIAKAGYDGIELFENDLTVSDLKPQEVKRLADDLGIEIVALQPFRDYEAMPKNLHLKSLERAEHKFDLMDKLGTKRLFVCSNCSPFAINDMDLAAEQLFILADKAEKRGIQVAYEALSWGRFVNLYHQSIEIVKRANHQNLGNLLDSYHICFMGENLDAIRSIPKEKLTFVQVADAHFFDMSAIYVGRHLRCFPGQGSLPVEEYMRAIQATGYSGYVSHEIFSDDFRAARLDPTALDGKRSLLWLENTLNATTSTDLQPKISDIKFIEFATDFINQQNLIALLTNLGFQETYRHKSKDVSLYQLAGVTIVLNREKTKLLEKTENVVIALGFVTKNVTNMELLANKLAYGWIPSAAKTGELPMPALKGIDNDILYYLIDENNITATFYETEFMPTGKKPIANGVTNIDHIGHTVGAAFVQSNTLFYRAMLGFSIEESVDIFDPNGIVHSKVVKNYNNNIRVSLSATRNRNTSSDYFINKSGGAGIQQIAIASTDIFKTAQSIAHKEYILSMPSNYYDDLRAKGLLPLEVIQKMQEHHILFDTNSEGSFYHFYCKELNGLFFEVVQRTENYDRYGEVNAQLRLAAQARDRKIK